jgi:UDP-N-acetylmuramoyl-L-alanyl-D-glutamate--2,6-diaminopimelate ligase
MFSTFPVTAHSNYVQQDGTFVCIKGSSDDGTRYIADALASGARIIVIEETQALSPQIETLIKKYNATIKTVKNARIALAELSAEVAGYPAKKMHSIAVTGTKGKTTTCFILKHLLTKLGKNCALISTVHNQINDTIYPSQFSTAQPDYLHAFLKECVNQKIEWVVVEAAAQALSVNRLHTLVFDGAIYTNFSQEHGEFYASMHDYAQAKSLLINHLKEHAPLILNGNDPVVAACAKKHANSILVHENQLPVYNYPESLLGIYNHYNAYMAMSSLISLGLAKTFQELLPLLDDFAPVPGRAEKYILKNGALAYIDYAHNPSSVTAVLSALRTKTDDLIVVMGCSGNREKEKRPIMGHEAARIADVFYATIDNPRFENTTDIINDMLSDIAPRDMSKIIVEEDRAKAIQEACKRSKNGSIIAILGKGPDEYMDIAGTKYPFSEKAILSTFQ